MKLTVRRKYDVRKIASNFESSNELTKLFFDIRKTALNFKRSDALTRLFDCQTAAFDCNTVECVLTIVFCESSLQSADCNVICDEMSKFAFDVEIVKCIDNCLNFRLLKIHAKICS